MPIRESVLHLEFDGGPLDGLARVRSRPAKPGFYYVRAKGELARKRRPGAYLYELYLASSSTRRQVAHFRGNTHTTCLACGVVHERPERRYGPEAIEHAGRRPCSLCGGELA